MLNDFTVSSEYWIINTIVFLLRFSQLYLMSRLRSKDSSQLRGNVDIKGMSYGTLMIVMHFLSRVQLQKKHVVYSCW